MKYKFKLTDDYSSNQNELTVRVFTESTPEEEVISLAKLLIKNRLYLSGLGLRLRLKDLAAGARCIRLRIVVIYHLGIPIAVSLYQSAPVNSTLFLVKKTYRRKGIGSQLFFTMSLELSCLGAKLYSVEGNKGSRKFFEKHSIEYIISNGEDTLRRVCYKDNKPVIKSQQGDSK